MTLKVSHTKPLHDATAQMTDEVVTRNHTSTHRHSPYEKAGNKGA